MNGHSELVIDRVSKDDSGTYTCVAQNGVGTIKSLGFVHVKGKDTLPGIILTLLHLTLIAHSSVCLSSRAPDH